SRTEAQGLRGVFLDAWSDQIAADIAKLDLTHVCVMTSVLDAIPRPLAAKIRYLVLSGVNRDLSRLRDYGQLVLLSLDVDWSSCEGCRTCSGSACAAPPT